MTTEELLILERDEARANARILAHSYTHDGRPSQRAVAASLAYPVLVSPDPQNKNSYTHLVVIMHEQEPSVTGFYNLRDAIKYADDADDAGAQWAETYVAQVIRGPLV